METKGADAEAGGPEADDGAGTGVKSLSKRLFDAERDAHHRSALRASIVPGGMVNEDTGEVHAAPEEEYYFEEKPRVRAAGRHGAGPARGGSVPPLLTSPPPLPLSPPSQMRDPCCTKWTFRLYSSLVCCWVLPLLTFAPAYFLLSYRDKNNDYSEFELPPCKDLTAFYCLEGSSMAALLRAIAVWPPFLYTAVVGNAYLLLRARRAHREYIRGRRRQNAQRIRKDFLTKWESVAVKEKRLAREQAIYDKKVRAAGRAEAGGDWEGKR